MKEWTLCMSVWESHLSKRCNLVSWLVNERLSPVRIRLERHLSPGFNLVSWLVNEILGPAHVSFESHLSTRLNLVT